MKVYIFLAEGFEEIEAVTVIDMLRRADIDIKTVSITGKLDVTGSHGIKINADILFDKNSLIDGDMLILPGGMPGTLNLAAHQVLAELINYYDKEGKWLAAICAAPLVYGRMGLLKGKCVTCYPGNENDLHGAEIRSEKVVIDGKYITSRGPGTAMLFSLKLVEVLKGLELADRIKDGTLL